MKRPEHRHRAVGLHDSRASPPRGSGGRGWGWRPRGARSGAARRRAASSRRARTLRGHREGARDTSSPSRPARGPRYERGSSTTTAARFDGRCRGAGRRTRRCGARFPAGSCPPPAAPAPSVARGRTASGRSAPRAGDRFRSEGAARSSERSRCFRPCPARHRPAPGCPCSRPGYPDARSTARGRARDPRPTRPSRRCR